MTLQEKIHIRLGIRSVSPFDQSPRCPHEETLGPYMYLPIGEISVFYFSPRKKYISRKGGVGVSRRNAKKELFSWADL